MSDFSHLDASGAPRMVNVGAKSETKRTAIARAVVELNAHTLELLKAKALPKGDVLTVAQVAGIMAAKHTSELIPMCHPLAITHADVRFKVQDEPPSVLLEASASTTGRTGVEMEAIIAAQIAASTIYDMVKAVQKDVVIRDVRLILKSGGKSGLFKTDDPLLFEGEDPAKSFPEWMRTKVRYDERFANTGGVVRVKFYIEPDGRITGEEVLETPDKRLSWYVVKAIRSSRGKWTPRKVRGVPQRTAWEFSCNYVNEGE